MVITGINLAFYDLPSLDHVTMMDLSEGMLDMAKAKAANLGVGERVDFVSGDVQELPFHSEIFDTVTDTFSFCVFAYPQTAMQEMARVLKPGALQYVDIPFDASIDMHPFFSDIVFGCNIYVIAGGQLLLLEHSKSPNLALGLYQDLTEKPVKSMGKGCSWNQNVQSMVKASGLNIQDIRYDLLGTVVSITATKG